MDTHYAFDGYGRMTSKSDGTYSATYAYRYDDKLASVTSDFPSEGNATYQHAAASGGATRSVTLSLDGAQFQFGGTGSIGLGGVSVNSAEPYSSIGTITLEVTLNGCNYEVGTDAVIDLTLHDVFDFDYFTPQNFDESRSAAMIQSGFGKTGSVANAGQVGLVEVEVHGDVKITERTITP